MAPSHSLDDPDNLNAFLALIGGAPVSRSASPPKPAIISSSSSDRAETSQHDLAGSPGKGTRAPPPTPATQANTRNNLNGEHLHPDEEDALEPVGEDETAALVTLANKSTKNLTHSKHASTPPRTLLINAVKADRPALTPAAPAVNKAIKIEYPVNKELLEKMKALSAGATFQDSVVEKFRNEHSQDEEDDRMKMVKIEASEDRGVKMVKIEGAVSDAEEFVEPAGFQAQEPAPDVGGGGETTKPRIADPLRSANSDATVPFPPFEESKTTTCAEETGKAEDRENLTYFKSWGTAPPRDTLKARIRTVVLTNLPVAADNTLVASLIHGGAIETIKLARPSKTPSATARVTFTTGEAAQSYYEKYPNGIVFKFQGKKHTAFVELGKDVDVISGVMRGYLETGASRIVRATGAEDDWGIQALNKLAEGKGRQVEAIVDTYRGEVRTVIFRFANIPDAVQFKASLVRDVDWELCNIQFVDDPCEKATNIRWESY